MHPLKKFDPGLVAVVAAYIVSRVAAYIAGVRFDIIPLGYYWQYIDIGLLTENLAESLYYFHANPPLFNLFLGLVLKLVPRDIDAIKLAFHGAYVLFGLVTTVALYLTLLQLKVHKAMAVAATVIFAAGPASILYENWLFYTHPLIALLVLSALFLSLYLKTDKISYLTLFFFTLSAIALVRSLFHLVWFMAILGALILLKRTETKKIAVAAAIPLLLIIALYAKNLIVFDTFSSSSWMGMSLARMTLHCSEKNKIETLVREGKISGLSLIEPFSEIGSYSSYLPKTPKSGIEVLDSTHKKLGYRNLNHTGYLSVSDWYMKDALTILYSDPLAYPTCLAKSFLIYFQPASALIFVKDNKKRIEPWDKIYNRIFYGQVLYYDFDSMIKIRSKAEYLLTVIFSTPLFLVIGTPLLLIYSLFMVFRPREEDTGKGVMLLYLAFNIIFVATVGNMLEVGENNRYRLLTEPFLLMILCIGAEDLLARIRSRREKKNP